MSVRERWNAGKNALAVAAAGLLLFLSAGCGCRESTAPTVRLYAAVDRTTAEPVLEAFRQRYGIVIETVFDTETAKTAALAARLEHERGAPRADVWWSGEAFYTTLLEQRGLLEPLADDLQARALERQPFSGSTWIGAAVRLRVLVYDRRTWPEDLLEPTTVAMLADSRLKGRIAMAYPTTGTSATHAAWLASFARGRALLEAIAKNDVILVPGNAYVVQAVNQGHALLGLTDSDDVLIAQRRNPDLKLTIPDQGENEDGCVATAASAAVIADAPHPVLARELVRYLTSAEVERKLAAHEARHLPLASDVPGPPELPPLETTKLAPVVLDDLARDWEGLRAVALKLLRP